MQAERSLEELLEKAKAKEKAYNWVEAAKIYEKIIESCLKKNMVMETAKIYKKLGYAYYYAARSVDTAKDVNGNLINAIHAYQKAKNLFRKREKIPEELECEASSLITNIYIINSLIERKKMAHKALELLNKSYDLYIKTNDQMSAARTLSLALVANSLLLCNIVNPEEKKEFAQKGLEIFYKSWNLSKEINNLKYLADTIEYGHYALNFLQFIIDFVWDKQWREHVEKGVSICEESLKLVEDSDDNWILGIIYSRTGAMKIFFGHHYIESETKLKENLGESIKLMEKGLEFLRKTNDKFLIMNTIFSLVWWPRFGGDIEYVQKRVINDLKFFEELAKIYANTFFPEKYYVYLLPTFYYTSIARMTFFTPSQRKIYAEKGIEYANKFVKEFYSLPRSVWGYQSLTWCFSLLATLTKDTVEKENLIQNALKSANEANKIGERYEGGYSRASGYSSLYIVYETLAKFAINKEEKIKMLSAAADASKKYLKHAIEGAKGIIIAKMRLGLLFEELANITGDLTPLMEAREIILEANKESFERGFHYHTAATHEYIARIDDRLGNYSSSAINYENAKDNYAEAMKSIEYKLLRRRVNEKKNYTKAWNLIENAKNHHKKEKHLEAKANYKAAYEILKDLPKFIYEAKYFLAWANQEEAEQLSKQELHDKAIEQYKKTKNIFNESIKTIEQFSNKSKDKTVIERIEKLATVAELRIKYCSARADVEKARVLGKEGSYIAAAELFASAASLFREVCNSFKIERERNELEGVYYLCRAWESMEFAEKYEEPDRFSEAANLFSKASNLFSDSKLKLLALGNSTFCQALEIGCKFDEAHESEVKAELYPKIKGMLRNAASTYEKGDFENGSNWALATSTYFDAAWHIIRADEEMKLDEKSRLLEVGSGLLRSTAELFSNSGYKEKEKEVLKRLNMVEKEEKIIFSALNSIKKPEISSSTVGIVAPVCSLETSQSPRLGEIQQIEADTRRAMEKKMEDSPELYEVDTSVNIIHLSDIQEGRFGIKEDMSSSTDAYYNYLSDLESKLEIIHRKNKIDFVVISGDLASTGSKEEYDNLTKEFIPILKDIFLEGVNTVPKHRWIIVPGNHDVEWDKGSARFNNFILFCQENGFHPYKLNEPEAIYSDIVCKEINTGNTFGIIGLNSCLDILDENSRNESNISKSYFSGFSKTWDNSFREIPKLMVCHHMLHTIKGDKFDHALNALRDNNVLLSLAGDIHKSDSHADEISKIRCIPAGTISASKSEREFGIDAVSRQFNLINLNLQSGYVKWYTYILEGTWREIKNESFYLDHTSFSKTN